MRTVVDRSELLERIENDLDFLADALDVYREDCPKLISIMRTALSHRDAETLGGAAHTLAGLFSNLAAHSAVETAIKLQEMARHGDLHCTAQLLDALEGESTRLQDALEEILR